MFPLHYLHYRQRNQEKKYEKKNQHFIPECSANASGSHQTFLQILKLFQQFVFPNLQTRYKNHIKSLKFKSINNLFLIN